MNKNKNKNNWLRISYNKLLRLGLRPPQIVAASLSTQAICEFYELARSQLLHAISTTKNHASKVAKTHLQHIIIEVSTMP